MPRPNLFIVTSRAILLQSSNDTKALFTCGPDGGIVNAKPANDNSGLIAVADSQLVLIHDLSRELKKEYKLKGGAGGPRLLLFSPQSAILYFTTTLGPTIQVYSVTTAELLPPLHGHLSPPNILVSSLDGSNILSASPMPPTVVIQDMGVVGGAPIAFQPDTESPAACAIFHPDSAGVFAIGFFDGMLTVYRSSKPRENPPASTFLKDTSMPRPKGFGSIKRLHKASMGGILAIEFIRGYYARIVSVGHDGRCRLIDFETGPKVLRTWYVSGPATSLAVTFNGPIHTFGRRQKDVIISDDANSEDNAQMYEGMETLIAVGIQTGKVLVFNVLGLLKQEIIIDSPIISLEWVGQMNAPSQLPPYQMTSSPPLRPVADILLRECERAQNEREGIVHVSPESTLDKPSERLLQTRLDLLHKRPQPLYRPVTSFEDLHSCPGVVDERLKPPEAPMKRTTSRVAITSTPEPPTQSSQVANSSTSGTNMFRAADAVHTSDSGSKSEISDGDDDAVLDPLAYPHGLAQAAVPTKSRLGSISLPSIKLSPVCAPSESIKYSVLEPPPNFPKRQTWRIRDSRTPLDGTQSPAKTWSHSPRKCFNGNDSIYSIEHGRQPQNVVEVSGVPLREQNDRLIFEIGVLRQDVTFLKNAVLALKS